MKLGLFDIYTSGHHLPYASKIKQAIEANSDVNVKFITLVEMARCNELFNPDDIVYIDDSSAAPIEERDGRFDQIAEETVNKFFNSEIYKNFDILHFLFSDDILGPLYRHAPESGGPHLVGEINGAFFERNSPLRHERFFPLFLALLGSPAARAMDALIPERTDHEQLWRDLFLYRCMMHKIFNSLITHSDEAFNYVSSMNRSTSVSVEQVPYPTPTDLGSDIDQRTARKRIGLPFDDSVLLFFGTLHKKKGIGNLIDVLERYEGPEFVMHIAGPPIDVNQEELSSLKMKTTIDIITELTFIENPEVYYRAADAIVLPYTRQFGKECTSQTMKEACSARLPVIVPDFGAVGRVAREWSLGIAYDQGSNESLQRAIVKFAREGVPHSKHLMEQYTQLHSYDQAARDLLSIYNS